MKSNVKRFTVLLLAFALVVTMAVGTGAPTSNAATATYSGSESYMSGRYYAALTRVELTGDARTDIINVAKSQVGYLESDSSSDYSGETAGGDNYTEYGRWYGEYPNPAWCAAFVSWCAYVCGISESVVMKHQYTETGLDFFQAKNQAYDWALVKAGVYTPQRGDLVYFYNGTAGRTVTHVGLVEKFENGILYTVEGNTMTDAFSVDGGCCATHTYSVSEADSPVVYICSPNYDANVDAPSVDIENGYYVGTGDYTVTGGGLNVRSIPSSTAAGTSVLGAFSTGAVFTCIEVVEDADTSFTGKYWAKIDYQGQTGYVVLNTANIAPAAAAVEPTDPYALSADKATYALQEQIKVSASGTVSNDWVGIYKKGEVVGTAIAIYRTNLSNFSGGKITINGGANVQNNISSRPDAADFANGLPAGEYIIVLCSAGTNTVEKSIDVVVGEGSSDEPTTPPSTSYNSVWFWNFGEMPHTDPQNSVTGTTDTYISFTDSTNDSQIYTTVDPDTYLMTEPLNCDEGKILVVKLRLTANATKTHQLELYCGTTSTAEGGTFSYVPYKLAKTEDWQYAIIDCEALAAQQNGLNPAFLTWGGTRGWLRLDPLNKSGSSCDLDWMAFFTSVEDANDYIYAEQNGLLDAAPSDEPTAVPTDEPTAEPTDEATAVPTDEPTAEPTDEATAEPTDEATAEPEQPTDEPATDAPATDVPATDAPESPATGDNGVAVFAVLAMAAAAVVALTFMRKKSSDEV